VAPLLSSPLLPDLDLGAVSPIVNVLQDMAEAGGDMADMAAAGDAAAEMTATMEAMTPAMTMSFLLPGIGLGLLKGLLIAELFRDRQKSFGHSYGGYRHQPKPHHQPQSAYGYAGGYQQPQYGQ